MKHYLNFAPHDLASDIVGGRNIMSIEGLLWTHGKTGNDRYIWRWTGHSTTQNPPVELIFTNHDLLTDIMPFVNGGYYNYDRLLYKADQTESTGIKSIDDLPKNGSMIWYDLHGRQLTQSPTAKGMYIQNGLKYAIR